MEKSHFDGTIIRSRCWDRGIPLMEHENKGKGILIKKIANL